MPELTGEQVRLQGCVDRLQAGDASARDELVGAAVAQLTRLTRKLLRDYPGVRRWEQTDDVLQNATLRLWKSLQDVTPRSLPEFFGLASLHIRRELIDLARSYYGPEGHGANHATWDPGRSGDTPSPGPEQADRTHDPSRLALWTEFHQRVDALPEDERAVFDLLWYQELTHPEAALLLEISERTLRRRWRSARVRVFEALQDGPPVPWVGVGDE